MHIRYAHVLQLFNGCLYFETEKVVTYINKYPLDGMLCKITNICKLIAFEKCLTADTERNIECSLEECQKVLGGWVNSSNCQGVGECDWCGSGHQLQLRTCLDGTSNRCTQKETTRMVPCDLPREGEYFYVTYYNLYFV